MKNKTKPPKPLQKAVKRQAKDQLADLRGRLQKIGAERKAKPKSKAPTTDRTFGIFDGKFKPDMPKKKRGRPPKPKPKPKPAIEIKPQPKERKMVRYRKSDTGEDIALTDAKAADEPTKVYIFHLNLVTPAVEATETEPAIPEYTEQQAEGVRWSDRTYTIHWTAAGPAVGYLTYPSLRHLLDTYPKLTVVFEGGAEPKDEDAAELEAKMKEAEDKAREARIARALAEEAKARVEARQQNHHA